MFTLFIKSYFSLSAQMTRVDGRTIYLYEKNVEIRIIFWKDYVYPYLFMKIIACLYKNYLNK